MTKPRLEPEVERTLEQMLVRDVAEDVKRKAEQNAGFLLAALLVLVKQASDDGEHLDEALDLARHVLAKVLGDDVEVVLINLHGEEDDDE